MSATRDWNEVLGWLRQRRRPLLASHRRPDGDALGALAGMCAALRQLSLAPTCVLYEPFPLRYAFLEPAAVWAQWSTESRERISRSADALVILDTCSLSQLEPLAEYLNAAPPTLVIDHHATRDAIGTRPGDLRLVDDSASAACLLVQEFCEHGGVQLLPPLRTALFTGLATDTGWFRFSNADGRTLQAAARLVAAGVAPHELYDRIYQAEPLAKLRLIARLLGGLELAADGRLALLTIRQSDFAATGADNGMTEDLVNEANRLAGALGTLMFTEDPDGRVRVNLRSKHTLDVAALAQQFGGGGHVRAAGARVAGTLDDVRGRVLAAAVAQLAGETCEPPGRAQA